jgi:hypothetical protein
MGPQPNEIDPDPKNWEIRLQRAALLDQSGLKEAAAFDRQQRRRFFRWQSRTR